MIRTFKYPLKPNRSQELVLENYLSHCRYLYNMALAQRIEAYKRQGITLSRFDQQKELAELREVEPEFKRVPSNILRSALHRLDLAFKAFFKRSKLGTKPGFPRFKGQDRFDSFSFEAAPSIKDSKILIPKLGHVKFHEYRPLKGTPLDTSIKKQNGKWFVSIVCDLGEIHTKIPVQSHIGIDVGLIHFATLSTGEMIPNPRFFRQSEDLLAKRQRKLALKKHGSKSRSKQKILVGKAHAHIRNQRLDHARKIAKVLFERFDAISYEDLTIYGMVHGNLAKSILDASWGMFIQCLIYKAEEAGKWAIGVDPKGTSQRCSRCGKVPLVKKTLSDRVHICDCGPPIDRDHNAAMNVKALGERVLESNGFIAAA